MSILRLVVWTVHTPEGTEDHWEALEPKEAKQRYEEVIKLPDLFSASLCAVIDSTDYTNEVPNE